MIDELLQGCYIGPMHAPLVFRENFYEVLVQLGNYAITSTEPPPKTAEQVQLVLNGPLSITTFE